MDFKSRLLQQLRARGSALPARQCFVGFDGFVDTIVSPVARRDGPGDRFTPFASITAFGERVLGAAGKSSNFEFYTRLEKAGGNGPIMAGALLALGARVTCAGSFGASGVHPVFADLSRRARLVSLGEPARTTAVEFPDGKLMLGTMRSLDDITPAAIAAAFGGDCYRDAVAAADLTVLANWTMIPNMTAIFADLTGNVLPGAAPRADRIFFFDLADPEKRSREDLAEALTALARFEAFGRVTLGLNLKEAQQVNGVLGFAPEAETDAGCRGMASRIRERLGVSTVVVHPKESAAAATRDGAWWVPGPYFENPLITTGAGDHFNAGFAAGQLLGLDPESCLGLGVSTSGHYVRTAQSPGLAEIQDLLAAWSG